MANLDFFSFVETPVADGDLCPLLELPRLEYVGTMDKRHYSHKCDEINTLLAYGVKSRLGRITRDIFGTCGLAES